MQRRLRDLPSRVGVYFLLAMCLFPEVCYRLVWQKLTGGTDRAERGTGSRQIGDLKPNDADVGRGPGQGRPFEGEHGHGAALDAEPGCRGNGLAGQQGAQQFAAGAAFQVCSMADPEQVKRGTRGGLGKGSFRIGTERLSGGSHRPD
ncbi:transposase domain-containing protein [Streptomyces sp. NBC_00191]|uniref:transposase domain-containing protein n=1 Tax=Streptomyces sp. NBC_00191 TaxID=2975674 RepID=UPI00386E754A